MPVFKYICTHIGSGNTDNNEGKAKDREEFKTRLKAWNLNDKGHRVYTEVKEEETPEYPPINEFPCYTAQDVFNFFEAKIKRCEEHSAYTDYFKQILQEARELNAKSQPGPEDFKQTPKSLECIDKIQALHDDMRKMCKGIEEQLMNEAGS